jgi:hypothetical protein
LRRPYLNALPHTQRRFLALLQREADATAALDYANIVPIYAFGEEQGMAFREQGSKVSPFFSAPPIASDL